MKNTSSASNDSYIRASNVAGRYIQFIETRDIGNLTQQSETFEDIEACLKQLCEIPLDEQPAFQWQKFFISICATTSKRLVEKGVFPKEGDCHNHLYFSLFMKTPDWDQLLKISEAMKEIVTEHATAVFTA